MGAIAAAASACSNEVGAQPACFTTEVIDEVADAEQAELERRERLSRRFSFSKR